MAGQTPVGHLEPKEYTKPSHGVHAQPHYPRGRSRPTGGSPRRCTATFSQVPTSPTTLSSLARSKLRPKGRRPGAETEAEQGLPQAHPAMGRVVHRRPSAKARDLQASQREGRNPHQRLEHRTATLLLPLNFQALYILFLEI